MPAVAASAAPAAVPAPAWSAFDSTHVVVNVYNEWCSCVCELPHMHTKTPHESTAAALGTAAAATTAAAAVTAEIFQI